MFIALCCFDYCAPEECYVSCFCPIELGIDFGATHGTPPERGMFGTACYKHDTPPE